MVGTSISHYKILEKIGEGGMEEVPGGRKAKVIFFPRSMHPSGSGFRARVLTGVGLVIFLGSASLSPGTWGPSADWNQFLGPQRNGSSQVPPARTPWPAAGPELVWSRGVGEGFAGPVVAGGRLILFHRRADREIVDCLDAKSGRSLWSFDYPSRYRDDFGFDEGPRATPVIAEGKVFTFGAQGVLTAASLDTGRKLWSVETHRQFGVRKGFFGAAGSPLVEAGRVFANIGGRSGAGLVAFDATTGETLWTATSYEASYSSPVAANLAGVRRVLFFTRNGLVVTSPDGDVVFDFPWRSRSRASVNAAVPLVVGNEIFLSASYNTGAVVLKVVGANLEKVWESDEVLSNHYATSVFHRGYLYGFHGRQEYGQSLRCVEWATGRVVWNQAGLGAGTVMLLSDQLLILSESGELIQASATPQGFRPRARARILEPVVRAYPAFSDGFLYARNADRLACFRLP
ncbi:PQQ-binding-like beta-propeller repeat protein [Acidobacteria bacterium AH-259-A15]|nr:PQQ-binding-like beta-propeller repeat protein [Acidobacteria bacterium AH-259-A15]